MVFDSRVYVQDLPADGSAWRWEGGEHINVLQTRWNGEEWWVQTVGEEDNRVWNDIATFKDAVGYEE